MVDSEYFLDLGLLFLLLLFDVIWICLEFLDFVGELFLFFFLNIMVGMMFFMFCFFLVLFVFFWLFLLFFVILFFFFLGCF